MGYWSFGNLRTILESETDSESPGSEELLSQIRENIEALFMLLLDTGISGTATSDPSNDANGYFYDTAGGWTDDLHNGRTLLITSGSADGNAYTIDDTVDATNRLDCTGDNLYADGVRSGDSYKILFDTLVNTAGHNHDGVNSRNPALEDDSIDNVKLHTAVGNTSVLGAGVGYIGGVVLQDYCFAQNIYGSAGLVLAPHTTADAGIYSARFGFYNLSVDNLTGTVYYRYITATDEPFIYALRNKLTGEIVCAWMADDPPPGYWGLTSTPENFIPPVQMTAYDPAIHEHLVHWRADKALVAKIREGCGKSGEHPLHKVLQEGFDFDAKTKIWKERIGG